MEGRNQGGRIMCLLSFSAWCWPPPPPVGRSVRPPSSWFTWGISHQRDYLGKLEIILSSDIIMVEYQVSFRWIIFVSTSSKMQLYFLQFYAPAIFSNSRRIHDQQKTWQPMPSSFFSPDFTARIWRLAASARFCEIGSGVWKFVPEWRLPQYPPP